MWFLVSLAAASSDLPLPTTGPVSNPPATAPAEAATLDAATLTFDCKVPAEILVDGMKVGQLWFPGEATWRVSPGKHLVRVYVAGTPQDYPVELDARAARTFLVGRTGTTVSDTVAAAPVSGPARVGLRVVGVQGAQVRIDGRREVLQAGAELALDLPPGPHALSVRSLDGTAVWSTGTLEVSGGPVVVQISEGRVPEVSGGAVFHSGG
jgi:hypothetical protein